MMNRTALAAIATLTFVAGCDDTSDRIAKANPVSGNRLVEYSSGITKAIKLGDNADLVQRFCQNAFKAPCPTDVASKLQELGFRSDGTGIDLANVFALWKADELDGSSDLRTTDEVYVRAAYHVALGREPDEGGGQANLGYIQQGGTRQNMLRSLLESPEFRAQR